ncbi:MAG: 2,3-bisphosphoglycerate-independent phosphoglycerate mutase [Candidatus Methanoperedenaceae archaeon]|nr:2,3-bisphosphoglycerate-independent phosphoglycerate mutase [Candidatus Methanoperedenaceae archaeon]
MIKKVPLLLMILDGFGMSDKKEGNAIAAASTPNLDMLFSVFPHSVLDASGEAVGLPDGLMGNSEVGHLNIGAGRVVYQHLTRISKSIRERDFFKNRALVDAMENVKKLNTSLHLIGLLSDGGVHSDNTHLYALLRMAKEQGIKKVYIHAFLDGRDVPPKSAPCYIKDAMGKMKELGGEFATISGRYYAMDRDKRWERVKKAYDALVSGKGEKAETAAKAVENAYEKGETDEFVSPTVIVKDEKPVSLISDNDSVIFFNFRSDRAREITRAFIDPEFTGFKRDAHPKTHFVCFTRYDETFGVPVAFQPDALKNILSEVLSRNHIKQLRIAETEKYAHVTFFFNGGEETAFDGEERVLVPSPKVPTYEMQPEMSAYRVTDEVEKAIVSGRYEFIVLNYANLDMVGHTGVFEAAVKAVEAVDECVGRVYSAVENAGGLMMVTGDHGNAEKMVDSTGGTHTAHTTYKVPFIFCEPGVNLRNGILADIAPTILDVLGIEKPADMTGKSLIIPG